MFSLTISCLTTSNLPSFMDLTFQVPMQYCSLRDRILLSSPDTSATQFRFGWVNSFFLELLVIVLQASPVAYWTPSNLGIHFFSVISLCPFIQFMGFSWQVYWGGLPFPLPVDHLLSELSTMTRLFWVALHLMAHRFIELFKPLHPDKAVIHEGI